MADTDEERYVALKHAVADIGYVRRGSITRRFMPCGKERCCCQASPPELHGPYYQWTRKVRGKTVTVRLTKEEAQFLEGWIANARQLDKIIAAMDAISMRLTQRMLRQQSKR